jgi:hypothetical protein
MPSIELVCIGQVAPLALSGIPFAVEAGSDLQSHRGPGALFHRELSQLRGCMYHLGNPQCREPDYHGFFFAYELLSRDSRQRQRNRYFQVASEFRESFKSFVGLLLRASPARSVFFTTDWQFGPRRSVRGGTLSESEFWLRHDTRRLKLNACYTIVLAESAD